MHSCIALPNGDERNEKGPLAKGGLSAVGRAGGSDADGGEGYGDGGAEAQDQGWRDPVEEPFEMAERHDTHLELEPPGERRICYLNSVKIAHI